MKVLLSGNMARDGVVAERLAREGCELHIASSIDNPSLTSAAARSKGQFYPVNDIADPRQIAQVATVSRADLFWTNSDEALARGTVDAVAQAAPGMLIASPNQASARIEWDKFEAREIIGEIEAERNRRYNPIYFGEREMSGVLDAIAHFRSQDKEVVIKPPGLTGGKGVKVMGPHLESYGAAAEYAAEVIRIQGAVDIEEKILGHEFTIQGLTDGNMLISPPVTYDYPYREDGDKGPGTGGMGSFTMAPGEHLPFMTEEDHREAFVLMGHVLRKLQDRGRDFKGVLYGSFFKNEEGLKVVEFNARMGDPEGLNIIELLSDNKSLANVLRNIAEGSLSKDDVRFRQLASAAVYLVSPNYAYGDNETHEFELDPGRLAAAGCRAYFGAAERIEGDRYRTTGPSRTVALTSRAPTPWEARANIHEAIRQGVKGPLQYRQDIADLDYVRIDLSRTIS